MQAYILLDRSGSMQSLWVEALSSVNAFAKELANKTDGPVVDSHVTLAVFDSQEALQFDVLRKKQPALHWDNVTDKDASPRGMTPLLDAMVRIISLAESDNPDKAIIVVMTDGQENASREVTREGRARPGKGQRLGDRLPRRQLRQYRRRIFGRRCRRQADGDVGGNDERVDGATC